MVSEIENCLKKKFTLLNSHYIWTISTLILNILILVQMCSDCSDRTTIPVSGTLNYTDYFINSVTLSPDMQCDEKSLL